MSVRYTLVFKDNETFTEDYICFGHMDSDQVWRLESESDRKMVDVKRIEFHIDNYMNSCDWCGSSTKTLKAAKSLYFKEMKELLNDIPMYKPFVKLQPRKCRVTVNVLNKPIDLVMSALFLFRNFSNYDYIKTYRMFRDVYELRPLLSAALCHAFVVKSSWDNSNTFQMRTLGEYNWFNPHTFGKFSLLNLMKHTSSDSFRWKQEPMNVVGCYLRDESFSEDEDIFFEDDTSCCYWKLTSPMCISGDEPLLDVCYKSESKFRMNNLGAGDCFKTVDTGDFGKSLKRLLDFLEFNDIKIKGE